MTIAYLTHDEVNAATARKLAARLGFDLAVLNVRQTDPAPVRVVFDLDHLPPDVKAGLLANARHGIDLSTVGVHSYHLSTAEARLLRRRGASVSRRLNGRLFGAVVHILPAAAAG